MILSSFLSLCLSAVALCQYIKRIWLNHEWMNEWMNEWAHYDRSSRKDASNSNSSDSDFRWRRKIGFVDDVLTDIRRGVPGSCCSHREMLGRPVWFVEMTGSLGSKYTRTADDNVIRHQTSNAVPQRGMVVCCREGSGRSEHTNEIG